MAHRSYGPSERVETTILNLFLDKKASFDFRDGLEKSGSQISCSGHDQEWNN